MILKAAWVVPVSAPPIRDGGVRVDADRIVAVGPADAWSAAGDTVVDLGAAVLTPGLVNAHSHLELTCYAGRLPPQPLWDWLIKMVRLRLAPGQVQRERQGVQEGAWQSLRAGVTCVGDISRRNLHWDVLKPIPIRKVCFAELLSVAAEPPRNLSELRAELAAVQEDALLTAGVSPHAPYSVPFDQIRAALALAARLHRPWCAHWAETSQERGFLRGDMDGIPIWLRGTLALCGVRPPNLSAIDYLEQCVADAPPGLLAHFNYAEPGDAERLAAAGHSVAYCPRSHRYFGHPPHPYRELMAAGVNVAIGTDSAASNDNLAILEELRILRQQPADAPPPAQLLEMATLNAARALGLLARVGTLEPGKQADLAAFPCSPSANDPVAELIDTAPPPLHVWVAGQQVF